MVLLLEIWRRKILYLLLILYCLVAVWLNLGNFTVKRFSTRKSKPEHLVLVGYKLWWILYTNELCSNYGVA